MRPPTEFGLSSSPLTITVLGGGAWGSTLAAIASARGHTVRLWSRSAGSSLAACLEDTNIVISAVSMQGVRAIAAQAKAVTLPSHAAIVSATKGLDPEPRPAGALPLLPSQLWQAVFPDHPVAVLSGPNLAKEIQAGLPAATVVASANAAAAETVQFALSSASFRVYTNLDVLGVELGGTLKNVIAIAVGACDGLKLGTNAKAALITRGLAEIIRLGTRWGARPETFYGLAGLGDLMATCNSPLSRNYQVGFGLAQGQPLAAVLSQLQGTAEGVNTTQVLINLAEQQQIDMPISQQVDRLVHGEVTPATALEALMLRDYKPEN